MSFVYRLSFFLSCATSSLAYGNFDVHLVDLVKRQNQTAPLPPLTNETNPWQAAGNGDVRSPCPLLNTFANHGILPRDGKNISIATFNQAQVFGINLDPSLANTITTGMMANLGLFTNTSSDANIRINLDQLDAHNQTEHDASLTRFDIKVGNDIVVNPGLVQDVLQDTSPTSAPNLTTASLAQSRVRIEQVSQDVWKSPPLSNATVQAGINEAALLLMVVGQPTSDPAEWPAPKDRASEWLTDERFPFDLGWNRSETVISAANSFTPITTKLAAIRSELLNNSTISN